MAKEIPSQNAFNIAELKQFFKQYGRLKKRRVLVQRFVQYMGVTRTDIREIRSDLLDIVGERDVLIALLAIIVLRRHAIAHPEVTLPLVKELFDKAIEIDPPGPFSIMVPSRAIFKQTEFLSKELYLDMVTTYLDRFEGKWWSNLQMRRYSYLDAVCLAEVGKVIDVPLTPIARRYVEKMITDRNYSWIKDFIQLEVTLRAIEVGHLRFAFSALELLIDIQESSVREAIIELLARVRVYYPNEVDDFLERNNLEESFITAVHTRVASETIGDLLDYRALIFWEEAILNSESVELWRELIWLFGSLSECHSLEQWFTNLSKVVINEIYGDAVFTDIPVRER